MNSIVPGTELTKLGLKSVGVERELPFALAEITLKGETTAGRVIFGPDDVKPVLGATALGSAGIEVDPVTGKLRRVPAISLR